MIIRYGQYCGAIALIIAMCFASYYSLSPISDRELYSFYIFIFWLLWLVSALMWRRRLSIIAAVLPGLFFAAYGHFGLGYWLLQRGFVEMRAPFDEYEQNCRKHTFIAEGHRIEFCERMHNGGGFLDIWRDEGSMRWASDFEQSQTFRSALEFHAKYSPDSAIYTIGEILSDLSRVRTTSADLGMGFHIVSFDPGF